AVAEAVAETVAEAEAKAEAVAEMVVVVVNEILQILYSVRGSLLLSALEVQTQVVKAEIEKRKAELELAKLSAELKACKEGEGRQGGGGTEEETVEGRRGRGFEASTYAPPPIANFYGGSQGVFPAGFMPPQAGAPGMYPNFAGGYGMPGGFPDPRGVTVTLSMQEMQHLSAQWQAGRQGPGGQYMSLQEYLNFHGRHPR
ncbi:hypothetical protein CYMTET_41710, partial [Cymbomonas tetramitiformis]